MSCLGLPRRVAARLPSELWELIRNVLTNQGLAMCRLCYTWHYDAIRDGDGYICDRCAKHEGVEVCVLCENAITDPTMLAMSNGAIYTAPTVPAHVRGKCHLDTLRCDWCKLSVWPHDAWTANIYNACGDRVSAFCSEQCTFNALMNDFPVMHGFDENTLFVRSGLREYGPGRPYGPSMFMLMYQNRPDDDDEIVFRSETLVPTGIPGSQECEHCRITLGVEWFDFRFTLSTKCAACKIVQDAEFMFAPRSSHLARSESSCVTFELQALRAMIRRVFTPGGRTSRPSRIASVTNRRPHEEVTVREIDVIRERKSHTRTHILV